MELIREDTARLSTGQPMPQPMPMLPALNVHDTRIADPVVWDRLSPGRRFQSTDIAMASAMGAIGLSLLPGKFEATSSTGGFAIIQARENLKNA